jgi:hypothetical protein
MEPILAGFQKALFHFVTKCFFVLAINPASQGEFCPKAKRQRCIRDTKCVFGLSVRSGSVKTTGKETGFVAAIRQK